MSRVIEILGSEDSDLGFVAQMALRHRDPAAVGRCLKLMIRKAHSGEVSAQDAVEMTIIALLGNGYEGLSQELERVRPPAQPKA